MLNFFPKILIELIKITKFQYPYSYYLLPQFSKTWYNPLNHFLITYHLNLSHVKVLTIIPLACARSYLSSIYDQRWRCRYQPDRRWHKPKIPFQNLLSKTTPGLSWTRLVLQEPDAWNTRIQQAYYRVLLGTKTMEVKIKNKNLP